MANVAHSTLSGSDLHEPKGVGAATSGQIYIADGLGSGAWSSASNALGFTGQVADFYTPTVPTGWLECDGTAVSRSTYATLFTAVTIQQSGTRTNGSAIVTGLSSTTDMRAGYFVGGTGITNGTTILTVDSSTQITMSANATSSGTSTVIISISAQGNGTTTFTLPDVKTSGRFRRSRTSSVQAGIAQADQNSAHTHTGTTATENAGHTHSGTTGNDSPDHTHLGGDLFDASTTAAASNTTANFNAVNAVNSSGGGNTGGINGNHAHAFTTGDVNSLHTHTFTSASSGGTEARPLTLVVITCIKT